MSENNAGGNNNQPRFDIRTLYVKDVSFESPQSPNVFIQPEFNPEIDVQMNVSRGLFSKDDGVFEVILTVTVTAKAEENTVFLCEVAQAGIFHIVNVSDSELDRALEIGCPNILLPFARQAVCDLVVKGGFPQLLVTPINFEAVYEQRRAQQAAEAS